MAEPNTSQGSVTNPQERLAAILKEVKDIDTRSAGTPLAESDATRMEALFAEADGVRAQIDRENKMRDLEAFAGRSTGVPGLAKPGSEVKVNIENIRESGHVTMTDLGDSVRLDENYGEGIFAVDQVNNRSPEYRDAFRTWIRAKSDRQVPESAFRTLQEGLDSEGGFVVPEDMLNTIVARLPTPTRVQGRVTQLQTSRDALVIPKVIYTADDLYTTGIRSTWTGEIPASSTAMRVTDPVFGQERIPIFTNMMSIPITNDMVEDAAFPLVSWISGKFAETIDLLKDNMILNGTGIGQPAGILLNPAGDANQPKVVVSGSASAVTALGLIKTAMSLPEQYDENATWVFNKVSTGNAIAQLLDANNRPIWGMGVDDAGLQSGYLQRPLVGYPVVFSGFMPNVGSSTYPAIFGDLRGYYLVNRIGFSLQVLRELYAETNQILVLGRIRFGGLLVEPWRVFVHQCHT